MTDEWRVLYIRVPVAVHDRISDIARVSNLTLSDVAGVGLREWLRTKPRRVSLRLDVESAPAPGGGGSGADSEMPTA